MPHSTPGTDNSAAPGESRPVLSRFLEAASALPPDRLNELGPLFATATGATIARILIADYDHQVLVELRTNDVVSLTGTVAGRVFTTGKPSVISNSRIVWLPMTEDEERLGAVELEFERSAPEELAGINELLRVLVFVIVSKRRYTDTVLQARRTRPLSAAAEIQWDLLPPLSSRGTNATISGRLDPAYTTGGDSFDYAFSSDRLEFVLLDAVGHGLPAVLKSVAAIGAIRNTRRERKTLEDAYHAAGAVLISEFGDNFYVTGVIGSLDLRSGELHWINAGHPLPLLLRNGHLVGELKCQPSMPAGLGGSVREIACESLQPGDKVLFYTDGVIEARSVGVGQFGTERLADMFLRATLDGLSTPEIGRNLSTAVHEHSKGDLADDAATVILDYHPASRADQ
jgi:serine phosphatase RsbU (regulator of sigma subunit)